MAENKTSLETKNEMTQEQVNQAIQEVVSSVSILDNPEIAAIVKETVDKLKETSGLDIPEDLLVSIGALFALPEQAFEILSEQFLKEFEQSLNNTTDKIELCQYLNIANVRAEDLITAVEEWNRQINLQLSGILSDTKLSFLKRLFNIIVTIVMDSQGISKRIIQIPIKTENGLIPKYANPTDAGADVFSAEDVILEPGETKIIKTGIRIEIPKGYEVQVRPRSGLSAKSKLRIANAPGTIDSGYRDEIGIICENTDSKIRDISSHYEGDKLVIDSIVYGAPIEIEKGQRIAQLVLSEVPTMMFMEVEALSTENDREGGFGSTGV